MARVRFPRGAWKWAIAFSLALLFFLVPLPRALPPWAAYVQWGLGALITVCLVGKFLYDTLFFDRYRP